VAAQMLGAWPSFLRPPAFPHYSPAAVTIRALAAGRGGVQKCLCLAHAVQSAVNNGRLRAGCSADTACVGSAASFRILLHMCLLVAAVTGARVSGCCG
jgi:hypothetical protein